MSRLRKHERLSNRDCRVQHTIAVPRRLLRWLWLALAWTAGFFIVTTVQGMLRADFDAWHQAVSALSLGPGGWMQSLNLICFGVVLTMSALVWRRILFGGVGAVWYPLLTVAAGCSFVLVGIIPQDPAPGYDPANLSLTAPTPSGLLHLLFAAVAALCSVGGLFVMAKRFAGDAAWHQWIVYTRAIAIAMIVCIAVYAGWSTASTGFAGTFERAAIVLPTVWAVALVRRLWSGTPFMVARVNESSQFT